MKAGADEAGNYVLEKVKSKAPIRTGNLAKKLKLSKAKKSAKYPYRVFSSVTTAKGAGYMVPLELGHKLVFMGQKTDFMVPEKPFLRPAADESKDAVVDIISKSLDKALMKWVVINEHSNSVFDGKNRRRPHRHAKRFQTSCERFKELAKTFQAWEQRSQKA